LHHFRLIESYPNINVALRIFLTLPVSIASCERSFSKLKLIKNYLRSTMGQERLSSLSILSIEHNIVKDINYDDVIDEFAEMKARKVQLH
ncbi:Zinc finger MYM-type protein, partial [Ooceraea biroi]